MFIAEDLLGKTLVRRFEDGHVLRSKILETEAYWGINDLASHASKGRTKRTEIMFEEGGFVYMYLIYGIHWLFNIVTGKEGEPEAVLIRGIEHVSGPGRIGKQLQLDKTFYAEDLENSNRLWIEESTLPGAIETGPRIGVDYAGELWKNKPWRFKLIPD